MFPEACLVTLLGSHNFGPKENHFPLTILWCYAFGLHWRALKVSIWNSLWHLLLKWRRELHLLSPSTKSKALREKYFPNSRARNTLRLLSHQCAFYLIMNNRKISTDIISLFTVVTRKLRAVSEILFGNY